MRFRFIVLFVLFGFFNLSAQDNKKDVISFEASFLGDMVRNFHGGINEGQTGVGLIHLSALFDTENARLWKGGNFYVHAHKVIGGSPSQELIGDIQVASNIDGLTNRFIYEMWYSHTSNNLFILGGLHNLNDVFHVNEYAGIYLNSSFGISPILSLNGSISIYPATTLGGLIKWEKKLFSILSGFYNYSHQFAGEMGFNFKNHNFKGGFYSLLETQYRFYNGDSKFLELKLGANYRQCSDNHQHNTDECPEKEELGIYFLTDLTLFKTSSGKNVGIFQQTGYCPRSKCISPFYYSFGGSITHIIFPKNNDQLAIAFASAKINQYEAESNTFNPFRNESVIEFTYKIQLHDHVSFQPDLQYIFNPAGTDIVRNAFVGLFRTEITF